MYVLKVLGIRRNTLAYHHLTTDEELREMLAVYRALGYDSTALIVEETEAAEQAA